MQQIQQQMAAEAAKRGMTPEEFAKQQREQLAADAAKQGMTPEQYVAQLRARAMAANQQRQGGSSPQGQQPGPSVQQQQQQQQPVNAGGAPDPKAVAVAKFLRSQDLKSRTCIMDGQRKDMFKGILYYSRPTPATWCTDIANGRIVKRALRALSSPAYTKARKKNPLLPEVTGHTSAENAFKLLPLSCLALRVSKVDPHAGHNHAPAKPKNRVKGLWTVKIEQHQDAEPLHHYVWLYEGPQWKQKAMAAGVVAAIFAVVLFPLWPVVLRQGVWYLSVGVMALLGLFFAMALFRLVLFCVTVFAVPPGLWLFPNLFEDVGVIDSFKPLWGWQEVSIICLFGLFSPCC